MLKRSLLSVLTAPTGFHGHRSGVLHSTSANTGRILSTVSHFRPSSVYSFCTGPVWTALLLQPSLNSSFLGGEKTQKTQEKRQEYVLQAYNITQQNSHFTIYLIKLVLCISQGVRTILCNQVMFSGQRCCFQVLQTYFFAFLSSTSEIPSNALILRE